MNGAHVAGALQILLCTNRPSPARRVHVRPFDHMLRPMRLINDWRIVRPRIAFVVLMPLGSGDP